MLVFALSASRHKWRKERNTPIAPTRNPGFGELGGGHVKCAGELRYCPPHNYFYTFCCASTTAVF